jgi:hypothetical protein
VIVDRPGHCSFCGDPSIAYSDDPDRRDPATYCCWADYDVLLDVWGVSAGWMDAHAAQLPQYVVETTSTGGVRIRNTRTGVVTRSRWMRPGWPAARRYAEQVTRDLNRRAVQTPR